MNILPFIYKETLHLLRDKRTMLVAICIPIVQMIAFGYAISTEVNNVRVAVAYEHYDNNVRRQIDRLAHNPYITVTGTVSGSGIADMMRRGEADVTVMFKRHSAPQVLADATNPNTAQASVNYVTQILGSGNPSARGGLSAAVGQMVEIHFLYNPQLRSSYNFSPAIMGMIFLLVCAMMTAVSIVRETETGTMEVLLVSPVRPVMIIVSKMVPFLVLSLFDLTLIITVAKYLFYIPMSGGICAVVFVSFIYILLALAMGLLVSTLARTQVVAMLISGMVMIVPVLMLSGMLFPIDNLPPVLKELSVIVPARWYIDAMRKLMVMGVDISNVATDIGVLLLMTIVLLAVSLRKFKDRLE
ncbi:MAG: ABC transporter permease [Bacteroidaceae bacterium]|nr:ABC transporter permease [Bacteroidaceae bacterium]